MFSFVSFSCTALVPLYAAKSQWIMQTQSLLRFNHRTFMLNGLINVKWNPRAHIHAMLGFFGGFFCIPKNHPEFESLKHTGFLFTDKH